jgi:hypothetical protein
MLKRGCLGLITIVMLCACLTPGPISGTIVVSGTNPIARSTKFGENYWCWNNYGDNVAGTESVVSALSLNVLRAGGHNNDTNTSNTFDPFNDAKIDTYVAYCRAVGAEPILQVPILKDLSGNHPASAQAAADIVTYCNKTKGYGIKYWEIGNEPDLYADQGDYPRYTVARFCADFNAFSTAMKAVDPTIKILGPELAWRYYPNHDANDWLSPFLSHCKGSFDIVAIHRYPFPADQCSIANAMGDITQFNAVVAGIRAQMAAARLSAVPLAITEANIAWDGNPAHSKMAASPQTFFAGLWIADTLGAAIRQGLWAMCYWSLSEYWSFGFVDSQTRRPKPNYYAFQMVSNHTGPTLLNATRPAGFSVYASRSSGDDATVLIVINKNATNRMETVSFSGLATAPSRSYSYTFPAYSLSCLSIPDSGGQMSVWSYTQDMAAAGSAPQKVQ